MKILNKLNYVQKYFRKNILNILITIYTCIFIFKIIHRYKK
uniref:Uncharacterized protein n=1 Tax=viral metagenome TaxID=1070528 RepID=A0A6C0H911_9ZZZZ